MYVHSFGDSHGYGLANSPGSDISLRYQFLVSNDATVPPAKKSQYALLNSNASNRTVNTYQYLPSDYVWMDATGDNVTRYELNVNGTVYHLSDLGYGDYCFGIDGDGKAELLCCFLESVDADYQTPGRVVNTSNALVSQTVKTISHKAFYYTNVQTDVDFVVSEGVELIRTNGLAQQSVRGVKYFKTVTLPSTLTKMESGSMTDATSLKELYINNIATGVEATNIFSGTAGFTMDDLSIFVNESIYNTYYDTLPDDRWGNVPKSCFVVSFIHLQDGDDGPIYYFAQKRGEDSELILSFIGNADGATQLVIPSTYTTGDPEDPTVYTVTEIAWNAFLGVKDEAALKKIVLPEGLKSYDHTVMVYPVNFSEFVISSDNDYFETDNGVLYDKGMTVLLAYPWGKTKTTFNVPEEVTGIAEGAFTGVETLKTVTVEENETFIGYFFVTSGAFDHCSGLKNVNFGKSVAFAGNAFIACGNLQTVSYYGTNPTLYLGKQTFGSSTPIEDFDYAEP